MQIFILLISNESLLLFVLGILSILWHFFFVALSFFFPLRLYWVLSIPKRWLLFLIIITLNLFSSCFMPINRIEKSRCFKRFDLLINLMQINRLTLCKLFTLSLLCRESLSLFNPETERTLFQICLHSIF